MELRKKLIDTAHLIEDYLRMHQWRFYKIPTKGAFSGDAVVLVNGPSLKKTFQQYDNGEILISEDSFFVNLSPIDPHFKIIKPKHYCVSDPIFYQGHPEKNNDIVKMYDIFQNEVDWDMYVYMAFFYEKEYRQLIEFSKITNPHIKFIRLNRNYCSNLSARLRNKLYASGRFMPEDGTIATTALYVALLNGYKNIRLYGADHTMFLDLAVNDNNELCTKDRHFYDADDNPVLKPYKNVADPSKAFRVHEYMLILYHTFHSHELVRQLADYLGAKIINCTKGSMIDSYEREII